MGEVDKSGVKFSQDSVYQKILNWFILTEFFEK